MTYTEQKIHTDEMVNLKSNFTLRKNNLFSYHFEIAFY